MKTKLTLDQLSDIDSIREFLLEKVEDKELRLKIQHSSSLGFLRGVFYGINHPVIIDHEKLKSKTY